MNQYLYRIQANRLEMLTRGATQQEASIISEHVAYLEHLTNEGTVLLFGRTRNNDTSTFGIVIFRAESDERARFIMNNDPAVKNGVMRAELFPYKVAGLNANHWTIE